MSVDPRQSQRVLQVMRPAVGGMKAHVLQLVSALRAEGFECELAAPAGCDLEDAAESSATVFHAVPIVGPLRPWADFKAALRLRAVVRERRPALVHAHGFKAALIARAAVGGRRGRVPVVVTVHNHVLYRDISRFAKWRHVVLERALARRTARIITVSDALRAELIEEYGLEPTCITTVHNGLDLSPYLEVGDRAGARRRLGVPDDALVYGIAARFAPQKAMDVLVRAAVPVLENVQGAWLVLAGDGPLLDDVRAEAERTTVAGRIVFPGFERDVPGLLAALDVYVSSALSEGLPLATIEAMAAGLPVVSTRSGGTPEVVEDGSTGLLAEPGSTRGLAEAMLEFAAGAETRRRFGDAGRARALAEFTEERMVRLTAEVYREVLG